MYEFAHGIMAGVIITFVLLSFILIWIYIEQYEPPKKQKVVKTPTTEKEELSPLGTVITISVVLALLMVIGLYFAVAY